MEQALALVAVGCAALLAPEAAPGWQQKVNGGLGGYGTSVAVDANGDVIAGGTAANAPDSSVYSSTTRFAVAKLRGSNGSLVWHRQLGTTTQGNQAEAVAVNAAGDVFAAGQIGTPDQNADFAVVALHGDDGSDLWQVTIAGTAGLSDVAKAVAVDGAGDVVAGGWTTNAGAGQDFMVVKLRGSDGAELWRQTINGSANDHDFVAALAVDANGDVFAAGTTVNTGSGADFTVVKLAGSDGSVLWQQAIDDAGNGFDRAWALALDAAGDAVATGYVSTPGRALDIAVVKLHGSDGAILWQDALDGGAHGSDEGLAVTVNHAGDVLVAGATTPFGGTPIVYVDFTVIKLSGADGSELWRHRLDKGDPLDDSNDIARAIVVDGRGDVFAGGSTQHPVTVDDFTLVKLDGATGDELWRRALKGTTRANYYESVTALAVDPNGHAVAVGHTTSTPGFSDLTVFDMREEISGRVLQFRDLPGQPERRKLVVSSTDPGIIGSGPLGPSDPTIGGLVLQLVNPSTGEHAEISLPAANWRALAAQSNSTASPRAFAYRDSTGLSPCTRVLINSAGLFKASCQGPLIGFSLDEASQGTLGINLKVGTGAILHCMLFGGHIVKDVPGRFAATNAAAPAGCPAP